MTGIGARHDDGDRAVLAAAGIEKAYRRGVWPAQRRVRVLRGVDLALAPGEVVGLIGRAKRDGGPPGRSLGEGPARAP